MPNNECRMTMLLRILEMIRFSHTLFALPFALSAALMAWYINGSAIVLQQTENA